MDSKYIDDQTFTNINFSKEALPISEYEYCSFLGCDFSNVVLTGQRFLECEFVDCNFSNATLADSSFQTVVFKNCKMLGLQFESCDQFGFAASFGSCQLDHSSFHRMKLNRTSFTDCLMEGVDFSLADLKGSKILDCNLLHAIFQDTILEKVDLRKSVNYIINPEQNRIKNAKFSLPDVIGLLDKYKILID